MHAGSAGGKSQAAAAHAPTTANPADVIPHLERHLAMTWTAFMVALTRTRDSLAAAGPAKHTSWHAAGMLEWSLARSLWEDDGCAGLPLGKAAALRLPNPDRLALHNMFSRVQLLLERLLTDAR